VVGAKRRLPCALAGLGCLALAVLLGLSVGPRASGPDEHLRRLLRGPLDQRPYRKAVKVLATETGWPHSAYGLALLPVLLAGAVLAVDAVRRRPVRLRRWRWLALAMLAIPLQHALRVAFDRAGPSVPPWADGARGAYPSGAAMLLALGWGVGLVVAGELRPRWRPAAVVSAVAVLGLHAAARVAAEKHWATDVAGGYLLAAGVLLLAAASRE
jgi:membrane-associated phospholipid phosphatase